MRKFLTALFKARYAVVFALVAIIATGLAPTVNAATGNHDASATFGIYPKQSETIHINASNQAGPPPYYLYSYEIASGAGLSDTIPVYVCLDAQTLGRLGTNDIGWDDTVTAAVTFDPTPGGITGDVETTDGSSTPTSSWAFSSDDSVSDGTHTVGDTGCKLLKVSIDVPTSVVNNTANPILYKAIVTFSTENGALRSSTGSIHFGDGWETNQIIQVAVQVDPATVTSDVTSCYLTDSAGIFLTDCEGNAITNSGADTGTFAVVRNNGGRTVATNPGQFYYNLLWKNNGETRDVTVDLITSGLVPTGAQAVHWWVFSGTPDLSDFNIVLNGNPAGSTGEISQPINVPSGSTLYVTYHLAWNGLKSNYPPCGTCGLYDSPNALIRVHGEVYDDTLAIVGECTAEAWGYDKQ